MTVYDSAYTGPEIDTALGLAITALQPGEGGIVTYEDTSSLPLTGVTSGTLALVRTTLQGDSAVFLWNGTPTEGGWYKLATVNLSPTITTGPETAYAIPTDGSPIVLTLEAEDPEGLPIVWSYQVASGDPTGIATVAQVDNQFTISGDPAAISSETSGTFSLSFVASDGVSLSAATSMFTLTFVVVVDMSTYTVTQADVAIPDTAALSGMNEDGTIWWRLTSLGNSTLRWYELSTPFDLSSAGPEQTRLFSAGIRGVMFADEGAKLVLLNEATETVDLYVMSTPNDPQSAAFHSSMSVGEGSKPRINGFVTPNGQHVYVVTAADGLLHYSTATPWDFTGGTLSEALDEPGGAIYGIFVSGDGAQLIIVEIDGDWTEYSLSTPFDVSSGTVLGTGNIGKSYAQFLAGESGYAYRINSSVADIFTYATK